MQRWLTVAAVVVLCMALVIGIACGGEEEEEEVKTLKLGLGLPLTGGAGAIAGLPFMWAMDLVEENIGEFEVGGERYRWKFLVGDSMPGGAVSLAGAHALATKFIYEDEVDFLFTCPIDSVMVTAPITEEIGMILFGGVVPMLAFGPEFPRTFAVMQMWDLECMPLFDFLSKEHPGVKTVVISHGEDRMGEALYDGTKAACDYYGLELHAAATATGTVEYYPIASKLMTYEPDLVIGNLPLFTAMWDMGYEGFCASYFWAEAGYGMVPWDRVAGKLFVYMPHPMQEPWPEVAAFAARFEHRYGSEVTPAILLALIFPEYLTQMLEKAGTVTNMDRIIEVLETETFDTCLGPVHFGGEEIIGAPRILMLPQAIWKVVGPGEYEVVAVYTAEELEALANEIYAGR